MAVEKVYDPCHSDDPRLDSADVDLEVDNDVDCTHVQVVATVTRCRADKRGVEWTSTVQIPEFQLLACVHGIDLTGKRPFDTVRDDHVTRVIAAIVDPYGDCRVSYSAVAVRNGGR